MRHGWNQAQAAYKSGQIVPGLSKQDPASFDSILCFLIESQLYALQLDCVVFCFLLATMHPKSGSCRLNYTRI